MLSRGAWLRGVLWSARYPLSFFSWLELHGVLRSARYPLPSFSRGVSSTAFSGLNATRFLRFHAACSSAAYSGLHATRVDSAFSRPLRQLPRHRSGLDATLSRRCFLAAVRNIPRHLSGLYATPVRNGSDSPPGAEASGASFGLCGVSSALAPSCAVWASAASLGLDATPVRIGIRQSAGSIASRGAASFV